LQISRLSFRIKKHSIYRYSDCIAVARVDCASIQKTPEPKKVRLTKIISTSTVLLLYIIATHFQSIHLHFYFFFFRMDMPPPFKPPPPPVKYTSVRNHDVPMTDILVWMCHALLHSQSVGHIYTDWKISDENLHSKWKLCHQLFILISFQTYKSSDHLQNTN